ncbi:HAMP domain-containing histidine kinase [Georgenia yuyongxinii]|uniref:histidine kinase n=1 Tax=Georgenia yuyongxinii TaxID=2589797 RepID=A0A5B8C925_9MICO|nr:HAMP domain-containing sensor histidine kinase [Georgenia yuyongxinii]QDC25925.1 HAMP domain-containing histidine kinase [Georgenia yuyongxinii]
MTTTIERLRGSGGAGGLTVRSRILATVLALTLLTLVVAGGTAWVLQRDRVDAGIDASLQRTVEEFTAFATSATDPQTGQPYASAQDLIYAGMQREVPGPHEGMAGFVEGRLELELPTGLKINEDPELTSHLEEMIATGPGRIASVTTASSEYRYAIVKVTLTDVGQGALVVAYNRSAEMDEVDDTFRTYALVAAIALVVLAAVGWVLAGRLLSPLRHLRETAESITDTDLSRRIEVRGNDDLSELTRTVNAMLGRLEDAFTSQRELLDDAGHELRTPITIVRGHLELMDPDDPADAAATKELALSELDRMHRLADDLVLLAKSERPDFVQPAKTSIGELTDNVLDQARALGERRWLIDARLEGEVLVDTQRITQALLQLAANAVKFSEPGSVIALGSTLRGGRLLLWVRDEGIGIAPDEQARVFERFGRASQSVGRDGAGLGLAIVAAIAAAHGGRVDVDSKVGAGSVFVLDLPARGAVVEQVTEEIEPVTG